MTISFINGVLFYWIGGIFFYWVGRREPDRRWSRFFRIIGILMFGLGVARASIQLM